MNLSDKQVNTFLDTLVKIIEDREKVCVEYSIVNQKGSDKKWQRLK